MATNRSRDQVTDDIAALAVCPSLEPRSAASCGFRIATGEPARVDFHQCFHVIVVRSTHVRGIHKPEYHRPAMAIGAARF